MIRYREQATAPDWPAWSEPNTEDPTTYIPVGRVDDGIESLIITRPAFDPEVFRSDTGLWEVWEPAVCLERVGHPKGFETPTANEAKCRALAAAFLAAADVLAEITAEDNDYPLEME